MRFARVLDEAGTPTWARVAASGESVQLLPEAPWRLDHSPASDHEIGLDHTQLLAPAEPSKIVLASSNYREVLELLGKSAPEEPLLFLKPPTAVVGPGDELALPPESRRVTGEPELALVIGRPCTRVSVADAADYVFGFTCLNDMSARDIQDREVQFTRAKGYDTFCPIGPWIETTWPSEGAVIAGRVDGIEQISSTLANMVFSIAELVSFASHCMTLVPGDVISTGASGIIEIGDCSTVTIGVEGVGELTNPARAAA